MTAEVEYVFRCDYCGSYATLDHAVESYVVDRDLDDGRVLVLPAVHCSAFCARTAVEGFPVGSRG